jgi:hypothetical protein
VGGVNHHNDSRLPLPRWSLAFDYQSSADPGADGKDGNRVHAAARAETPFAVRDGADVVEQGTWQSIEARDRIPQGYMRLGTRKVG